MAGHHMTADEVKKHVRIYIGVLLALLVLTVATVGVSYLHLPIGQAIAVAMAIATLKGALVALYFMHLSNEKKIIYGTLALTAFFFLFLMAIPFFI